MQSCHIRIHRTCHSHHQPSSTITNDTHRDLAGRLVLRLFAAILSKIDSLAEDEKRVFPLAPYSPLVVVGVLLQTLKAVYRTHTLALKSTMPAAGTGTGTGAGYTTNRTAKSTNKPSASRRPDESATIALYADVLGIDLSDATLRGGVDLLLDVQTHIVSRLPALVAALVEVLVSGGGRSVRGSADALRGSAGSVRGSADSQGGRVRLVTQQGVEEGVLLDLLDCAAVAGMDRVGDGVWGMG